MVWMPVRARPVLLDGQETGAGGLADLGLLPAIVGEQEVHLVADRQPQAADGVGDGEQDVFAGADLIGSDRGVAGDVGEHGVEMVFTADPIAGREVGVVGEEDAFDFLEVAAGEVDLHTGVGPMFSMPTPGDQATPGLAGGGQVWVAV